MFKKTKLFKKYDYPSWSMNKEGEVFRKKYNSCTWWPCFLNDALKCSLEGTGYTIKVYKNRDGIIGASKLSFSNILKQTNKNENLPKITAKQFLNYRLQAEAMGFKTYKTEVSKLI